MFLFDSVVVAREQLGKKMPKFNIYATAVFHVSYQSSHRYCLNLPVSCGCKQIKLIETVCQGCRKRGQEGQLLSLPFSKGGRGGKKCPAQSEKSTNRLGMDI